MSIPIITDVGGLVGGIIGGGIFFIIILSVCILYICGVAGKRIASSFRNPQQQSYQQLTQPYPGQQVYPTTPSSTQPQQPPPSYHTFPPPYSNLDTSNIHQQPPPPYPGTQ